MARSKASPSYACDSRGDMASTTTSASSPEVSNITSTIASNHSSPSLRESIFGHQEDDHSSAQNDERGMVLDCSPESNGIGDIVQASGEGTVSSSVAAAVSNEEGEDSGSANDTMIYDTAVQEAVPSETHDEESGSANIVPCPMSNLSYATLNTLREEISSSDTEQLSKKTWNRTQLLVSFVAMLILAATMIAVIVPLRQKNNVESSNNGNDLQHDFIYRLRGYILTQDWSDPLSVLDPTSPQYKAIQQLALEVAPLDTNLEQRYAVLVVWYGLGGEDVYNDQHECEWKDLIQCDSLDNVTALTLQGRALQGTLSEEIGKLTNLIALVLSNNQIQGTIPSSIYNLVKLTTLELGQNELVSNLSDDIGLLSNLETLMLFENQGIYGTMPQAMKKLTQLKTVQLRTTSLVGPIMEFALNWPLLEELTAAENVLLTGTIPTKIGSLSHLQILELLDTGITGTVPSEIGLLSNLELFTIGMSFQLGLTRLNGTLPPEIGNCHKLDKLVIRDTSILGTIPPSFGNLTLLYSLVLRGSQLEGTLPDSLQNLSTLNVMNLDSNQLTGTLPEWLGMLPGLVELRLQQNDFSGTVPSSICSAKMQFGYDCNLVCDCCGKCGGVSW